MSTPLFSVSGLKKIDAHNSGLLVKCRLMSRGGHQDVSAGQMSSLMKRTSLFFYFFILKAKEFTSQGGRFLTSTRLSFLQTP